MASTTREPFASDSNREQNLQLADLLTGLYLFKKILRISRNGDTANGQDGWEITWENID